MPLTKDFGPVTVLMLPPEDKPRVTADWVRTSVDKYKNADNFFDRAFFAIVIFHGAEEDDVEFTDEARDYLSTLGNEKIICVSSPRLLPGPYVLEDSQLRDVWRLVDDANGTCMTTLKPQSK